MARIIISTTSYTIRQMRRQHRMVGLTIRVKNQSVFIMKKTEYVYNRSKKQDECRERFRRAQELASADLKDPDRLAYWTRYARDHKRYKTIRGCCISYWYNRVDSKDIEAHHEASEKAEIALDEALERGESGEKERLEVRRLVLTPRTYGTESADVLKARRKASGYDDYEYILRDQDRRSDRALKSIFLVKRYDIHSVDLDEVRNSDYAFLRNGARTMKVDIDSFVHNREVGRIDQFLLKKRRAHSIYTCQALQKLYQVSLRKPPIYKDKIYLTSDVVPRQPIKKRMEVTLEELQYHDFKEELKTNDICVTVAGRMVFLNEELIDKLRDLRFLRSIRGITVPQMERLRKANYKLRKRLAAEKAAQAEIESGKDT